MAATASRTVPSAVTTISIKTAMETASTVTMYGVRPGDTLARIAAARLHSAGQWPALWWVNRSKIRNPDSIYAGQQLQISPLPAVTAAIEHAALAAIPHAPAPPRGGPVLTSAVHGAYDPRNAILSPAQIETLWVAAGGPSWAAGEAVVLTECESGHNRFAYNTSGASGLFQILGSVVPGNLFDAWVNALNAVRKFRDEGSSFKPAWVCNA